MSFFFNRLLIEKRIAYVLTGLLVIASPRFTLAQSNYVATSPGAAAPGQNNVLVGIQAGNASMTGNNNAFIGRYAGDNNTSGADNTFIGSFAGAQNTTGAYNTSIGSNTGFSNYTGTQNTFLGYYAGYASTATANTFVGYKAGFTNSSGQFNSFIGVQAGLNNTTGSSNYFFGTNSGLSNTTGSGNYFLGDNAGGGNSSGGYNIYIGANAGNGPGVNGDNNLSVGFESGKGNKSGANNTFLGFRADAGASSLSNATAIGNNAKVNISNALVLGAGANVGIGTSAPANKLEITQGNANQSGLRLTNLTSGSPASVTNQYKFLTVNASGDVVLGSLNGSARMGAESWVATGEHLQNANAGGVIIGSGVDKTPSDYNLFVSKGILTEKVKVAIKDTDEWSDYVFAPTYKLSSLDQVEAFVKVHKHLPGVPSAETVVKEGVDVGKMEAKLLEKIEELTLYVIELKRETRQQITRIQRVEKSSKKQKINH